jgi:Tfp pilus assembly protein PilF
MGKLLSLSFVVAVFVNLAWGQSGPGVDNNKGLPDNRIEGRVFWPSGFPKEPVRLRLRGDRGEQLENTDRDGRFSFRGLRPGRYTLTVESGGLYQTVSQMIDVMPTGTPSMQGDSPSQMATLTIRLAPNAGGPPPGTVSANPVPKAAADLYNSALKLAQDGDRKKAIELLKQAISIHPEFVAALNGLGVQYMKLGDFDDAAQAFASALKLDPEDFLLHLNYGLTLFQQKKYPEAIQQLDLAIQKKEASSTAHYYKGRALISVQRFDEAEVALQRTVALGGEEANVAHRYLAGIYMEKGDSARAVSELQLFLKLEPKTKDAEKIRDLIKQLESKKPGQ